jgi:hypothetical protein
MKKVFVLCTVVMLSRPAAADEIEIVSTLNRLRDQIQQAWRQDRDPPHSWLVSDGVGSDGKNPAPCAQTLAALRDLNVPADRTFELSVDTRDLKQGNHTVSEARVACDGIEHAATIHKFERWAMFAAEIGNLKSLENCVIMYDDMAKGGILPTERVPERKVRISEEYVMWSGTVEEIRIKYCDGPLKKAEDELAKEESPFRKVLKNDKLKMALATSYPFTLIGGESTQDPKKLAAASVWFNALSEMTGNETCPRGVKKKTLRRYTFDGQGKLLKQTEKDFCGEIPVKAFR